MFHENILYFNPMTFIPNTHDKSFIHNVCTHLLTSQSRFEFVVFVLSTFKGVVYFLKFQGKTEKLIEFLDI